MSSSIPDLSKRISLLVEILDAAYRMAKISKKRAINSIKLSTLSWGNIHEMALVSIQETLQSSIKLAYPKPGKTICIYTDASGRY